LVRQWLVSLNTKSIEEAQPGPFDLFAIFWILEFFFVCLEILAKAELVQVEIYEAKCIKKWIVGVLRAFYRYNRKIFDSKKSFLTNDKFESKIIASKT